VPAVLEVAGFGASSGGWGRKARVMAEQKKRVSDCGCMAGRNCICPSAPLLRIVGKRHTVSLVSLLANRSVMRFHELRGRTTPISSSTLAARLTALEHESLITRTVGFEKPPTAAYSLTARGRRLATVLKRLLAIQK
jgi:DNA-binding HxlR family transcriptional regulator